MERGYAVFATDERIGTASDDGLARGSERDSVHDSNWPPVANVASGVSAMQYGPQIFLRMAFRRHISELNPLSLPLAAPGVCRQRLCRAVAQGGDGQVEDLDAGNCQAFVCDQRFRTANSL